MDAVNAWRFVTIWGNAVLLLPTASCIGVGLWVTGERGVAWRWVFAFGGALLLVLATKIAFLGWGIGSAALDFTGISGHTTLAAAVLPVFAWWLTEERSTTTRRSAIVAAVVFACLIGVSRVVLDLHSASEAVTGFVLGSVVAWTVIPRERVAGRHAVLRWLALGALLTAGSMPGVGGTDAAHGIVTRLALMLSGHERVYERSRP